MTYETENGTNALIQSVLEDQGFDDRLNDTIVQALSGITINAYLEALVADSSWNEVQTILSMIKQRMFLRGNPPFTTIG